MPPWILFYFRSPGHFWDIFGDTINKKWLTVTCKPLLCGERGFIRKRHWVACVGIFQNQGHKWLTLRFSRLKLLEIVGFKSPRLRKNQSITFTEWRFYQTTSVLVTTFGLFLFAVKELLLRLQAIVQTECRVKFIWTLPRCSQLNATLLQMRHLYLERAS